MFTPMDITCRIWSPNRYVHKQKAICPGSHGNDWLAGDELHPWTHQLRAAIGRGRSDWATLTQVRWRPAARDGSAAAVPQRRL